MSSSSHALDSHSHTVPTSVVYSTHNSSTQDRSTQNRGTQNNVTSYQWHADALTEATHILDGHWVHNDMQDSSSALTAVKSSKISTDTRSISHGDIFLALSGENFDGHNYAKTAVEQGAIAIIVERALADIAVPQLVVSDSRLALGQLGAYRRQQHDIVTSNISGASKLKVVAITGSSGKTTVKEMLGSIFNRIAPTLVTRGNLNNDLGVPMMLLELADEHEFAILELGANHIGEIAYTATLVNPDVACILNIGTAHLGEFGGRDKIAQAKAEIYQALARPCTKAQTALDKTAIIPEDDEYAQFLQQTAQQYTDTIVGFGKTDVTVSNVQLQDFSSEFTVHLADVDNSYIIRLPLAGEHNVSNALAVIACARAVGVSMQDIVHGLEMVQPPKGRLYSKMLGKHRLIDDAYNANPHSVRASARVLSVQQGLKIMVLGDIGELGDSASEEHYNLGKSLAKMDIDMLYTLGEFAQTTVDGAVSVNENNNLMAQAFLDKPSLLAELIKIIHAHDLHGTTEETKQNCTILFKGSRFMKMESLFNDLFTHF